MTDYTVQSGDSLSRIAAANDISLGELLDHNPQFRSNPNLIHPGDVVHLNAPARHQAAAASTPGAPAPNGSGGTFDYNRIAGVRGNPNVTPQFLREVEAMASRLGTRPEYILAVMSFETGGTFSPSIRNPNSGATGLIQFIPSTARGLGTSTDALARMTPVEQLHWVEKYFDQRSNPGQLDTIEGVYTTVFYGSPRENPSTVLFDTGDGNAYYWNRGLDLNQDGRITAGEAAQKVRDRISGELPGSPPPSSPPPPSPPGGPGGTYTVRSGDTLSGIASRHGTTWQAIYNANRDRISDPDRIYPGQVLRLPGGNGNTPSPGGGTYTVRSGDTLSGIASRHGTTWQAIYNANRDRISDPDRIYPGQVLRLPGGNGNTPSPGGGTYTVRSGDTLSGIASRHGTTWQAIYDANRDRISDPDRIYPGQVLRLPGGNGNGSPPAPAPPGGGPAPTYAPWTVYSTGHRPAFPVDHPDQLQPHHDYQTRVRQGQTLEVRDVVLHHNGQSQTGQPVPAPVSGTVERVAYEPGGAGNYLILRGDRGELVYLFHFSRIDVRQGQRVSYGQDLGNQGSTGNSTGPHVHIEASPAVIDRWVHDLLDGRFDGRRT